MNIDVKINPAYLPYLNATQGTQVFYGGSSSGKSYFIAQRIVLSNVQGANWLCCRNVAKTIRNSVFNELMKAISNMGLLKHYSVNKSDMVITNNLNGKQILFAGLDDVEKVKSITPANGVLERIFVEEATEIKYEAYKQLTKRLRGVSNIPKYVILAFNPILKSHWIYQTFFGNWQDDKTVYKDRDLLIVKTTYKDNYFLTPDDREKLENESDPYFRNVYSLGNWGILGHVIFKNWRVEDLSGIKDKLSNLYFGMDFGWNDPTAIVKLSVDRDRKKIYVLDEIYQQYLRDEDLLRICKKFIGTNYVTCDCAEPKLIDFLCNGGIRALPAVKGADSIMRGIRWLQGYEIIVDVRCQNFKNEIEQYHFDEDKFGNVLERPVDFMNHLIDSARYATETLQFDNSISAGMRL